MVKVIPFRRKKVPKPEPMATLTFNDMTIEIDYTYMKQLFLCDGWAFNHHSRGDEGIHRHNMNNMKMREAIKTMLKMMYDNIDEELAKAIKEEDFSY